MIDGGEQHRGVDVEVLSVAPHFGIGSMPFAGHEETYQLGLSRAAEAAGIPWRILVPESSKVLESATIPCLDRTDAQRIAQSLDRHLRTRGTGQPFATGVVVYEADVALAAEIARVAAAQSTVLFLVNLFRAETGLDVPLVRRKRFGAGPEAAMVAPRALAALLGASSRSTWSTNLLLTAESEAKALMANSAGLPVDGVWHLHSEMAAAGAPTPTAPPAAPGGPIRVLVALRSSQLHPPLVRDVLDVIEGVGRIDRARSVTWVMSGRFDADRRVMGALRRLERAGVEVTRNERPLDPGAYAQTFLEVDAVWMPAIWPYRIQSSGKALDALVLGRPVIAPAGTAGADAMRRWVPGAPTYGTPSEAIQLFLRLPSLTPTLQRALHDANPLIRDDCSPTATVAWIVERLAQLSSGQRAPERAAAPPAASRGHGDPEPLSAPSGPLNADGHLDSPPWRRLLGTTATVLLATGRMVTGIPRACWAFWHAILDRR